MCPLPAAPSLCLTSCALLFLAGSSPCCAVIGNPAAPWSRQVRHYKHLEGDVRWRRLYSATRYFLTIDRTGHVRGTRRYCSDSIFQVHSVSVGAIAIHSVGNKFYLAMNRRGKVYGAKDYGPNCSFRERIEENGYNSYASMKWHHRGHHMYLALRGNGMTRQGSRTRHTHLSTHFLPLPV